MQNTLIAELSKKYGFEEEYLISKGPSQYIVAIPGDWGEDIAKCFGGVSDQVRIEGLEKTEKETVKKMSESVVKPYVHIR